MIQSEFQLELCTLIIQKSTVICTSIFNGLVSFNRVYPPLDGIFFLPYKISGIGEYHLQNVCHFDPGKISLTGAKKDVFVSKKVENGPKRARNGTKNIARIANAVQVTI